MDHVRLTGGDLLRKLRNDHNLKCIDLARTLGVSQRLIQDYEGERGAPMSQAAAEGLADLFRCAAADLLTPSHRTPQQVVQRHQGFRLREFCKAAHVTDAYVEHKTGIPATTLSQYKTGILAIDRSRAPALAAILGVTEADILQTPTSGPAAPAPAANDGADADDAFGQPEAAAAYDLVPDPIADMIQLTSEISRRYGVRWEPGSHVVRGFTDDQADAAVVIRWGGASPIKVITKARSDVGTDVCKAAQALARSFAFATGWE